MTQYTQDDVQKEYEFKIVRSGSAAFRNPETLKELVEEESRAGWVMLEKFDDSRVRFKRPRSARARDAFLPEGVDPYRTQYGAHAARQARLAAVMIGVLVLVGMVGFLFTTSDGPADGSAVAMRIPIILIMVLGLAVLFVVKRQRLQ